MPWPHQLPSLRPQLPNPPRKPPPSLAHLSACVQGWEPQRHHQDSASQTCNCDTANTQQTVWPPFLFPPGREAHTQPSWQPRCPQKVESKGREVRWSWPPLSPGPSQLLPGAWNNSRGGVGQWGANKSGKEDVRTWSRGARGACSHPRLTWATCPREVMLGEGEGWWRKSTGSQASPPQS